MDKLRYKQGLLNEYQEIIKVQTTPEGDILMITEDIDKDMTIVELTLKEAQRVKRYLEDAITITIMNKEEK